MKLTAFALAAAIVALPAAAAAQTIAALTNDATLVHIDAQTRRATKTVAITGLDAPVAGIDVRPADGMLYALTYSGAVFTVDPASGSATRKSTLRLAPPVGGAVTVDFNPVANRLRIIGNSGVNLRANVDNGDVTNDKNLQFSEAGKQPSVIAGAYTNSVSGATETTLFDIDANGSFLRQAPPNDGMLNPVGMLGVKPAVIAFDIATAGTANEGWAVAGGALHKVDLTTGAVTTVGKLSGVRGEVRDIAVLPTK